MEGISRVLDRSHTRSRRLASYLSSEGIECVSDADANVGLFDVSSTKVLGVHPNVLAAFE